MTSTLEELRNFVLDEDKNVQWDAIRERYFEKQGKWWIPNRAWTGSERATGAKERVWNILLEENILSLDINGNYLILGAGVVANPGMTFSRLYFTREKDARVYAELKCGNMSYEVQIVKCEVVARS